MSKVVKCPRCSNQTHVRALADGEGRVDSSWRKCDACGWDQRDEPAPPRRRRAKSEARHDEALA